MTCSRRGRMRRWWRRRKQREEQKEEMDFEKEKKEEWRHLEELPVSEQQQHSDLHIFLHAFPTSLKVAALQGHIEVVPHIT